ncbi:MAG TPA: polysaccharide biosynthesis tyrosine autokinase [Acidisarcina sp.]
MNSQSDNAARGLNNLRNHPTRRAVTNRNSYAPRERAEITLQELWQMLVRRRGAFLLCLATATAAAIVISVVLPVRYEGVGRLTVDFESPDSLGAEALAQATGADAVTKLQTQVSVLETDSLAWDVIKRLRLDERPEAAHRKAIIGPIQCLSRPGDSISSVGPECRRMLIDEFHDRLHVQTVPRTDIIEIRYRSRSRELSATVVNTLADIFAERNFQTKYAAAMRASTWLSGQLAEVKRDAETAAEKYIAYQKRSGIIGTDENHNILIERLTAINQQLVVAESERIVRQARYNVARNGDPEALIGMSPGSTLQVLHTEEAGLKNQYAQLNSKYGEAYPRVVQLRDQLDQAAQATAAEIDHTREKMKNEYDAALSSENLLRSEFEQQKQQAYNTNEGAIQLALLKRDVDASNELYEQLVKRLKEAGIIAGIRATNVTVIDPADIPVLRVEPRPVLNLAWGIVAGSLFGLALCALLESADTTIATLNDVADLCPLPALGIVPRLTDHNGRTLTPVAKNGKNRIATLDWPESETADAYRSLRTALLLSNPGAPPRVLLVTSPLPREGKTTTSVNTAVVFAQKNRRVLLVDGDMRRADVARYVEAESRGGLSAVLAGDDPAKYYISHPDLPNLIILPAGERPPKPPDLLDSDRMRKMIETWRDEFDQIIIDAPPVIGLSDSVILSTMADTVVLVVRAGQSKRQDISRTIEILNSVDAKVSGAIVNDLDVHGLGYYGNDFSLYSHYFTGNERKSGNA